METIENTEDVSATITDIATQPGTIDSDVKNIYTDSKYLNQ